MKTTGLGTVPGTLQYYFIYYTVIISIWHMRKPKLREVKSLA